MSGIYKLTAPNGKCYIGQSVELNRRISKYKGLLCKQQRHLYSAIKKYGWENFKVEILWSTKHPERFSNLCKLLDVLEIAYIKHFDSIAGGYNIRYGGANGRQSEETKQKLREINLGKSITKETRAKISATLTGRTLSPESIRKRSAKIRGQKRSKATLQRMSEAQKGIKMPESAKRKLHKPVDQYCLGGLFVREWESVSAAAEQYNTSTTCISRACKGESKTAAGFQWRYRGSIAPEARGKVTGIPIKVVQMSIEGNPLKTWKSLTAAGKGLNTCRDGIREACKGNRLTAGGFKWKYLQ